VSRVDANEMARRISEKSCGVVSLDTTTYNGTHKKCRFTDEVYGEFWTTPAHAARGQRHPEHRVAVSRERAIVTRIPLKDVKEALYVKFGGKVIIVDGTYTGMWQVAEFVTEVGTVSRVPANVLNGNGNFKTDCAPGSGVPVSADAIAERIRNVHGDTITMDKSTYSGTGRKAKFVDIEFGEYTAFVANVLAGKVCRERAIRNTKETNLSKYGSVCPVQGLAESIRLSNINKYGVEWPMQNREIALKAAKAANNSSVKCHWETGEELVCVGSYEAGVVEYLNRNRVRFMWQPRVFQMPPDASGRHRSYRPDLYLVDEDKWVEIKGYFRKDAYDKWSWFSGEYKTAELWDAGTLKKMGIL
jgi:hypothetical protein